MIGNPLAPGSQLSGLEAALEKLPDQVADALQRWRRATLDREKVEALLYLQFRGGEFKRTADEIKSMVRSDGGRYEACMKEAMAESEYTRLDQRLMSWKRLASLRTAY